MGKKTLQLISRKNEKFQLIEKYSTSQYMTVHHSTPQYPTVHHSTPWYTTLWNTLCHGVHFSHISLQSHVATHLSQSEGSIFLYISDLVRNCEISPKNVPPFKEQSFYNSSAKNKSHHKCQCIKYSHC